MKVDLIIKNEIFTTKSLYFTLNNTVDIFQFDERAIHYELTWNIWLCSLPSSNHFYIKNVKRYIEIVKAFDDKDLFFLK
jgi:hypothetical protein